MSLQTYRRKRHFQDTPEPSGKTKRSGGALRFVVQKHDASRLHYDFRLELDGVLKSWAVPKGPSLNPADKRLAVMVEDHPVDYRTFEGVIPAGNYGAGTVIVWDQGTYEPVGATNRAESERLLREALAKGHVKIVLYGKKLQGEFALVRMHRGPEKNWLMFKKNDASASEEDVTADDRSVLSNRTLPTLARGSRSLKARGTKSVRGKKSGSAQGVRPMLATLVDEPFDRPGWIFEPKWDGYRAIAEVTKKGVLLYSRNHNSFQERFEPVVRSLAKLGHEVILDGEVVAVDEAGKSQFQLLQQYQKTGKGRLVYYVFDILNLDGEDLRQQPLVRRKEILAKVLGNLPHIRLGEHVETKGVAFFRAAAEQNLEGIIAKNGDSPYREGVRGNDWLKIKTHMRQEAVIGGYTAPRGSRTDFGALVLGVYDGDRLVYIGHTGGGFDSQARKEMVAKLEPLVMLECPFEDKPKTNAPAKWVEPRLVCEVSFQEWTADGYMRQPIFVGLREDKPVTDVHRENPKPAEVAVVAKKTETKTKRKTSVTSGSGAKTNGHTPALTNLQKVYWPDEAYTKGDLIDYYRDVSPILLPHLHDRPMSLHRHPSGIGGSSFFQKDVGKSPPPPWVETIAIPSKGEGADVTYLVCQDEPTLLYVANLGCIELNPWNSRVDSLDRPDYLILDLDPENVPFETVVETAWAVRKVLDEVEAACYCKTSGKRGLHICVPLNAAYTYDQARQFTEIVAHLVNAQFPDTTSIVRSPRLRQHRVYLDYLQNRAGKTLASPYSVRPAPGAPVSTPLRWAEVKPDLDVTAFTMRTMRKRLNRVGDLWEPMLEPGIDLTESMERLSELIAKTTSRGEKGKKAAKPKRRRREVTATYSA
jgi:bifunctional non-homologous end joining protein LigD